MKCPRCLTDDDKVLETRILAQGGVIRRRRLCLNCDFRFTSYERVEERPLTVVKRDDSRELFSREKLRRGIITAVRKRPVSQETIENMLDEIEEEAHIASGNTHEIPSRDVGEMIIARLQRIDTVAYLRFLSVYRNFENAEEFIQEIRSLAPKNTSARKSSAARPANQSQEKDSEQDAEK